MARYRIAVCDDEPSELEDIVQSVKRYDVHVEALRKMSKKNSERNLTSSNIACRWSIISS